jgi:LDH2 family malate/lactate/ureidoglycolate dehydrogenase
VTVDTDLLVGAEVLTSLTQDCFEALGVPAQDARAVAEVLIDANLHGVPSHGFQRLPIYMRRVHEGLAGTTERLRVVSESGPMCRVDAAHALGPAAAVKALEYGITLAGSFGIGLVAVGRSTHFGAAGVYARRAAAAGLASVVMTNATKRMAPHGAAESFIGTNALAIGIPLGSRDPFVLDIATSMGAQGKITRAKQLGLPIANGLAIGPDGLPTADPARALAGSLLPFAGPKGSGLALAISLLCVMLGHADSDDEMASLYNNFDRPQNTGHVFLLVDPKRLGDPGDSPERMVERLAGLRPIIEGDTVRYPGQAAAQLARARLEHGVPVSPTELTDLAELCSSYGLGDLRARAADLLAEVAGPKSRP